MLAAVDVGLRVAAGCTSNGAVVVYLEVLDSEDEPVVAHVEAVAVVLAQLVCEEMVSLIFVVWNGVGGLFLEERVVEGFGSDLKSGCPWSGEKT